MKRQATQAELNYAARWMAARGIDAQQERDYWYLDELPDPIRIVIDINYADGDEATFPTFHDAMNAVAVTLANFLEAANLPK